MINIITEDNPSHCLHNNCRAFLSRCSMKFLFKIKSMNMNTSKNIFKAAIILLVSVITAKAQSGEEKFNQVCKACHTIGGGKLVGPDLKGVTAKRSEEWLLKWTKSSQSLINSGDADAKAVFEANNKIPMPDQNLADAELKAIYTYIGAQSGNAETVSVPVKVEKPQDAASSDNASAEDILLGKNLFEGAVFSNGGPACISCHNVNHSDVIAGGLLAKDLTNVHPRMGGDAGLKGILGAPPFPAMTEAYKNKPLTEKEIYALTAFLNKVNKDNNNAASVNPLLTWGFAGLAAWICVVFILWYNRKKNTVKLKIYERQVRSF